MDTEMEGVVSVFGVESVSSNQSIFLYCVGK